MNILWSKTLKDCLKQYKQEHHLFKILFCIQIGYRPKKLDSDNPKVKGKFNTVNPYYTIVFKEICMAIFMKF